MQLFTYHKKLSVAIWLRSFFIEFMLNIKNNGSQIMMDDEFITLSNPESDWERELMFLPVFKFYLFIT